MHLWANIQYFTVQSGCVFKLSCHAKQNLLVGQLSSELNWFCQIHRNFVKFFVKTRQCVQCLQVSHVRVCGHWPGCVFVGTPVFGGASVVLYMAVSERPASTKMTQNVFICRVSKYLCKPVTRKKMWNLTERWSRWTTSRHPQSRTGTWWRWPCDWPGWRWQSGHWGSSRPPQDWRRAARPPSLIQSGSNTPPGGRPWRAARTCCCSGPGRRQIWKLSVLSVVNLAILACIISRLTFMVVKFRLRSNSNMISTYPLGKLSLLQPT